MSGAPPPGSAIVIGAGLAGCSAAERLAARGWQVALIERARAPALGASGNLAGVVRPLPSLDDNLLSRLMRAAFEYAGEHFARLEAAGLPLRRGRTGVLNLARDDAHAALQRRVVERQPAETLRFVEREAARELSGWPVAIGGWWFPAGGWVDPASLCRANLARHGDAITAHYGAQVARIERQGGLWHALDADGEAIAAAPVLILANATEAKRFAVTAHLPLRAARGQVSHLGADSAGPPEVVVCRLGYVTPVVDGVRSIGATFSVDDGEIALREADHGQNLARLDWILPGYDRNVTPIELGGRVGFRPLAPDRLPMVGAVADAAAIEAGRPAPSLAELPRLPGLYLINGFGARGIVYSALAGELLACQITGTPLPLPAELVAALDPGRFPQRQRQQRPARRGR